MTGLSSGSASAVLGFAFAASTILALTRRLRPRPRRRAAPGRGGGVRRGVAPKRKGKIHPDWDEADDACRDEPGWGIVSLGRPRPWHHEPARRRPALRPRPAAAPATTRPSPGGRSPPLPAGHGLGRREPRLDDGAPRPRSAAQATPLHDEDDEPWANPEGLPNQRPVHGAGACRAAFPPRRGPASAWRARRSPRCSTRSLTSCRR